MLLDPLEEQFHLPPVLVEQGDVLCTEEEVVRVVDKAAKSRYFFGSYSIILS